MSDNNESCIDCRMDASESQSDMCCCCVMESDGSYSDPCDSASDDCCCCW